jgi:hypothetical protein
MSYKEIRRECEGMIESHRRKFARDMEEMARRLEQATRRLREMESRPADEKKAKLEKESPWTLSAADQKKV